ncbi:MAG: histidine ammonia-lyase [Thermoplasmata archaeon]
MVVLDGESLTPEAVAKIAREDGEVTISPSAIQKMEASRQLVEEIGRKGRAAYGVTTGIGELANVSIPTDDQRQLQRNIARSHAAGTGEPLPDDVLRAMMVLRANGLARGYSGVRPALVELLCQMLNRGIHPVVPRKGSVGASGDLAPLAHMTLVMIGEGEAFYEGQRLSGAEALAEGGLEPLELQPKEGLALINGTSLMAAYGCLAVHDGLTLVKDALIAGSMSFEALKGSPQPFDARIHALRPHPGQVTAARDLLYSLQDSEIIPSHLGPHKVQDPYTLRCMPQVLGAVLDVIRGAEQVFHVEANSVTDNPLLFPEDGESLSGGNFHGQPLAFMLDFMAIALCTLGAYSERRIARLVDGSLSGLPPFLTTKSGLQSGLMLMQYTAAALASENKVLAHPASVDSIPTSANQEDFVPMGPAAGEKLFLIIKNLRTLLGIEYLCASQGLEFEKSLDPGKGALAAYRLLRRHIPRLEEDRPLSPDLEVISSLLAEGKVVEAVEDEIGLLLT